VRVNLVVVGDPSWQLTHDGFGIWSRTDADIVALDRANEGFSHSVALWTFERRRPRFEPDVAGEAAGVAGDVAAAVIRKPFDRVTGKRLTWPNRYSTDRSMADRAESNKRLYAASVPVAVTVRAEEAAVPHHSRADVDRHMARSERSTCQSLNSDTRSPAHRHRWQSNRRRRRFRLQS
jgi:hypothetical protein